ncbi:MAG TPA: hypothetical protein VGR20_00585, partial [Acidimicrobiia bacterium]|nr:hypothetical protein [Acidimicrobiia bacterium]
MRRQILSAAAPACLLIGLTPIAAAADLAPPGSATATALQATSLLGISSSGATAEPAKADARASVISVGGAPVLGTGGAQSSDGESGGALLDTGAGLPAQVQVAPWHASATGSAASTNRSSRASAAAARAEVPSVAKLGVLTSDAQAEHTAQQSQGASGTTAVDLGLADTARLVLLHSEVGSTGAGHSYLLGLNGTEIGTDEQLGQSCAVDAAGLVGLNCLLASGGLINGLTSGSAEVLGVKTALGLDPVAAFTAAASSGSGSAPSVLSGV